jgi:uncharacterized protein YebE (UPF0316 family)
MVFLDSIYDSDIFTYLILPLLILLARVCDVTIGTVRIVMVAKGEKFWAPLLGFFEVLIWLLAISKIFENLDNWVCYIAYSAGFAVGNYIGLKVEEFLAMGIVRIQIITRMNADELITNLKKEGYGITHHEAKGSTEDVSIIYSIIKRIEIRKVENIVKATNPNAFYTVEDVKMVSHGVYPLNKVHKRWRKGK